MWVHVSIMHCSFELFVTLPLPVLLRPLPPVGRPRKIPRRDGEKGGQDRKEENKRRGEGRARRKKKPMGILKEQRAGKEVGTGRIGGRREGERAPHPLPAPNQTLILCGSRSVAVDRPQQRRRRQQAAPHHFLHPRGCRLHRRRRRRGRHGHRRRRYRASLPMKDNPCDWLAADAAAATAIHRPPPPPPPLPPSEGRSVRWPRKN